LPDDRGEPLCDLADFIEYLLHGEYSTVTAFASPNENASGHVQDPHAKAENLAGSHAQARGLEFLVERDIRNRAHFDVLLRVHRRADQLG